MNQQLDHDHAELDARLQAGLAALVEDAPDRAFGPLDAFWAGLAVHIRAENLHLFPALLRAAKTSPLASQALPPATVEAVIAQLRADHDFFMRELAAAMKTLRGLRRPDAPPSASAGMAGLRETLERVRRRLADHNALEETQAYRWVDVLLDAAQQADLADNIRRELDNLPARLKPQATSCATESDPVCEACGCPDVVRIADRWLCPDCISAAGSCCPEFGAWDAWSSETGVAPRVFSQPLPLPVTHDASRCRFEIRPTPEAPPAFLEYAVGGDHVIFAHTFVPEALRRQGLAAVLTHAALTEARRAGWRIVPACSYVAAYLERHPEFADLITPTNQP